MMPAESMGTELARDVHSLSRLVARDQKKN